MWYICKSDNVVIYHQKIKKMEDVKTFRTKTGYCHITPDQIILNKDAVLDTSEKMTESDGVVKIVLVYILFAAYLIFAAYGDFGRGENVMAGILALVAVGLIYAIAISLDNSGTPVIDRNSIKRVEFTTGKKGLTRSVFVVRFENKKGKIKKRLIMLPGSLNNGSEETEKALQIMRAEKLIL